MVHIVKKPGVMVHSQKEYEKYLKLKGIEPKNIINYHIKQNNKFYDKGAYDYYISCAINIIRNFLDRFRAYENNNILKHSNTNKINDYISITEFNILKSVIQLDTIDKFIKQEDYYISKISNFIDANKALLNLRNSLKIDEYILKNTIATLNINQR